MKVERFCNRALIFGCMFILGFLAVLSFLTTQRNGVEALGEISNGCPIYWDWDNPLYHMIGMAFILFLITGYDLWQKVRKNRATGFIRKRSVTWRVVMAVCSTVLAMLLLAGGTRTPSADQIQVYGAATLFSEGVYANLMPGGYIEMYPQQLGYVLYLQFLFKIFGNNSFKQVQVLNCIIIGAIQYNVSGMAEQMAEDDEILILTEVLSMLFLPLFLMCSWVYGDLPSVFLELVVTRCLIYVLKTSSGHDRTRKYFLLCFMVFLSALALLFRKNAWIFILAVVIALCIHAVCHRKYILMLTAAATMVIPALTGEAVKAYYERKSGYEAGGLPAIMWIAMGITEGASKPGWFNNFSVPVYYETGYDRDMSAQRAMEEICARLCYFKENPIEAVSFYKRKIATQWNEPFWGTEELADVDEGSSITGISAYISESKDNVRTFLSVWQSLLYMGVFWYCVSAGKEKAVFENIGLIYLAGGFLFSILWEANSRYVMPYALFLIPYSAAGWLSFYIIVREKYLRRKGDANGRSKENASPRLY